MWVLGDVGVATRKYSPRAPSGAGQISKRSDDKLKKTTNPRKTQKSIGDRCLPFSAGGEAGWGFPQENIDRELRREPVKSQNGRMRN